jgi:hypothetical protein
MLEVLQRCSVSVEHRKHILNQLSSVGSDLIQLVTNKKLGFKVWEHSVYLIDAVLAREHVKIEDIRLFALTCLLISYKVAYFNLSLRALNPQMSSTENIREISMLCMVFLPYLSSLGMIKLSFR